MNAVKKLVIIVPCIVAVLLSAGCSADARGDGRTGVADASAQPAKLRVAPLDRTGSNGSFRTLRSVAADSDLPRDLPVYRVMPADVTGAWVKARAAKLGVSGEVAVDGKRFVVRGKSGRFEVDRDSGSFDYITDAFAAQTKPLAKVLDEKEYRARAEAFLSGAGLMQAQAEFRDVNLGNVVGTYEKGKWVERPYMVEVRFSHKPLDGVAFDQGVGPKIVVQFGEDGAVLGALSVWRNVEKDGVYHLKPVDSALDDVRQGEAQIFGAKQSDDGTVEDVALSYLNEPLGYEQLYVLPAYVMRGHSSGGTAFTTVSRAIPNDLLILDESLKGAPVVAPSGGKRK